MSKRLVHALSVLPFLALVLPGCEAPGDLAILLDGLSINGRPIAPDFEGSDMHLAETICCDSTTSEITVGLAGGNLPAAAEVTEAAPHLSFSKDGEPLEVGAAFNLDATLVVRFMTCGFDRTSFSIRVFDNSKVPSNAEAFLTFEIVNECFTPPSPGGVPLADLPAYVTGMKFFRPTTGTDDYQLYGFNADGTGEGRVTDNAFRDRAPEWSPDGTRLSFSSNRNGTSQDNYDLYVAEGTLDNVQRLTDLGMTGSSAPRRHAWSPDGTRICFVAGRDLYVIDAAPGKTPVQLTQGPEGDDQPTWSQDSSRIAFVRDLALWIMDADGGNAQMVLDDVFFAAWSPHAADGRRVAVQRGTGMFILEPDDSLTPWGDNTAAIADTLLWTTEDGLVSLYGGELWFIGETSTQVVDLDIDPLADTEGLTRR